MVSNIFLSRINLISIKYLMVCTLSLLLSQYEYGEYPIKYFMEIKFILDKKMLETIYLTYIRPLLEYANVIWDNNITYLVDKIVKVQMEAARIVTGSIRLVSLNNLERHS
jgi:hypothetical protein